MKAVTFDRYGSPDVLQYQDISQPQIKSDQMLVKVHASSINPIDWKIRQGMLKLLTGSNFPKILGFDVSGEVVEVGEKVKGFQPGDAIFAYLNNLPGGAYAEYAAVSQKVARLKPNNMTHEEAAAVPLAGTTALQALRDKGKIEKGEGLTPPSKGGACTPRQKVLINGASGGVGTFAVQIAKAYETEVTGVCSGENAELVKSLGADRVIDYKQEDFTGDAANYDIIFDVVSNRSFSECKNNLSPKGIYITLLPSPDILLQSVLTFFSSGKKATLHFAQASGKDLGDLKELIEASKIRSVIDRTYLLSELAAAHSYSEEGHASGKIIIKVSS